MFTLVSPLSAPVAKHLPITGGDEGDKHNQAWDTLVSAKHLHDKLSTLYLRICPGERCYRDATFPPF